MDKNKPLIIERTIHAPIERVWQALTDINELKHWLPFFPDFRAEVGFETRFELGPGDKKYPHVVKVLEVVDGRKLSYSWDYGGMSEGSSVSFELSPEGNGTKLVLSCSFADIPAEQPDFLKNASEGWNYTATSLKEYAEKEA